MKLDRGRLRPEDVARLGVDAHYTTAGVTGPGL